MIVNLHENETDYNEERPKEVFDAEACHGGKGCALRVSCCVTLINVRPSTDAEARGIVYTNGRRSVGCSSYGLEEEITTINEDAVSKR